MQKTGKSFNEVKNYWLFGFKIKEIKNNQERNVHTWNDSQIKYLKKIILILINKCFIFLYINLY